MTSVLTFRPLPEDDGTILKCDGSNPRLPNSGLDDSLVLNIMCKYFYFFVYYVFLINHFNTLNHFFFSKRI